MQLHGLHLIFLYFWSMEDKVDDIEPIVAHWRESSDENYATMQNLIKTKEYSWSLFLGIW